MLDQRQAFKFGFLLRCADEGLTPEQTQVRVKEACDRLEQIKTANVLGGIGGIGKFLMNAGLLGLGGSAALGAAGGAGLASLMEEDADPEDVKRQELAAAYQQQAERIRRSMASHSYRPSTAPRKPSLVT